ncbi:MAG TPA: peptide ABC transporter ATP-binding protein [Desulfobacteraceae bacterium]|nr:peptide ABC transporter ATP-binding protein [Desulfobacteraceae bacterium]
MGKNNTDPLLSIQDLNTWFFSRKGTAKAVNGVSFDLAAGQVLGVVGESGCGKSVTAQSVMQLVPDPPGKIVSGKILYRGKDLVPMTREQMRHIRGNKISMIFQEPMTSLNPVYTIGDQISEMFTLHKGCNKRQAMAAAADMLQKVQIPAPHKRVHDYPHQLSGGMRQRAMIAMALSCDPEILIADEPTTALDVTVQAQILDLMLALKEEYNTAIQMITHDLGVIAEMADQVVVMYAGRVVEAAPTKNLFSSPLHPYTKGLMASIPVLGERTKGQAKGLTEIPGMIPSLYDLPKGCRFVNRCPHAFDRCKTQEPELSRADAGHDVRCWLHSQGEVTP